MNTAPIAIALYNEGQTSAGFDWLPADRPNLALAELAETYVANVCAESERVTTVRLFTIDAPTFANDDCNDLLVEWLSAELLEGNER